MSILEEIVQSRKKDVEEAKKALSLESLEAKCKQNHEVLPPINILKRVTEESELEKKDGGVGVLAEIKRASPSKGMIAEINAPKRASLYAKSGAAAVSVLTEPKWFKGSLNDLREARLAIDHLPHRPAILRKDFIFDLYQVLEAREAGADSLLLIVAILSDEELISLITACRQWGMEPLVEAATIPEVDRALKCGASLVGVNARDLHTFSVSIPRAAECIAHGTSIQSSAVFIGLSGVSDRSHVEQYLSAGAKGVLVGESLMKAASVPHAIANLRGLPPPSPLVKICGICRSEDASVAVTSGADLIGLIFAPESKRVLDIETAREIARDVRATSSIPYVPPFESICNQSLLDRKEELGCPLIVGVFANQGEEEISSIAEKIPLDVIQLSGKNDVLNTAPKGVFLFRAIHVATLSSSSSSSSEDSSITRALSTMEQDAPVPFTPLLDTYHPSSAGGTGVCFDWEKVPRSKASSLIVAGGLNPENIFEAVTQCGYPLGVDVSSGVEAVPRQKDHEKVRSFLKNAKRTSKKES